MNNQSYKICIEEHVENWDTYFIATCDEIEWFFVEAKSIDKLKDLVPEIAFEFIRLQEDQEYRNVIIEWAKNREMAEKKEKVMFNFSFWSQLAYC